MKFWKLGGAVVATVFVPFLCLFMFIPMISGGMGDPSDCNTSQAGGVPGKLDFSINGLTVKGGKMDAQQAKVVSIVVATIQSRSKDYTPDQYERVVIIALITGTTESALKNLNGGDRDSVGVFQQRAGWGSFADRTNVAKATGKFLNHLFKLDGTVRVLGKYPKWKTDEYGSVAQGVQISAFPGAYSNWIGEAQRTLAALSGKKATGGTPAVKCTDPGTGPSTIVADGKWVAPLKKGTYRISSPWGWRNHPMGGGRKFHSGVDLGTQGSTPPVHAASSGKVVAVEYSSSWGNLIILEHKPGGTDSANKQTYYTMYVHLSKFASGICVNKPGRPPCLRTTVKGDAVIGRVGTTGLSESEHLHFNVCTSFAACRATKKGGAGTLDPVAFLRKQGVKL